MVEHRLRDSLEIGISLIRKNNWQIRVFFFKKDWRNGFAQFLVRLALFVVALDPILSDDLRIHILNPWEQSRVAVAPRIFENREFRSFFRNQLIIVGNSRVLFDLLRVNQVLEGFRLFLELLLRHGFKLLVIVVLSQWSAFFCADLQVRSYDLIQLFLVFFFLNSLFVLHQVF